MNEKGLNIGIVGGGVVGLTCAHVLSAGHRVTIVADALGAETDSIKATALWHVYLVPETEQVLAWEAELEEEEDLRKMGVTLPRKAEGPGE